MTLTTEGLDDVARIYLGNHDGHVLGRLGKTAASSGRSFANAGVAVLIGLGLVVLLLAVTGEDIPRTLSAAVAGSLSGPSAIHDTLIQTVPLLFAGLGVALAFRAGLINVGGDGQMLIGALFAAFISARVASLPPVLAIAVVTGCGAIGGALWGAIAGAMRAWLSMNEVITTLILNLVALYWVSMMVSGPLRDPNGGGVPWSAPTPENAQFPAFGVAGINIPLGILMAVIAAVVVAFTLKRTTFGVDIATVGSATSTAKFIGIPVRTRIIQALAGGGALAGIGGAAELAGNQLRLSEGFSPQLGLIAFAAALLGGAAPLGVVIASLFFGILGAGSEAMQNIANTPRTIAFVAQGLIVLALAASSAPMRKRFLPWLRGRSKRRLTR